MTTSAPSNSLQNLDTIKLFELIGINGTPAEEQLVADQFAEGIWQDFVNEELLENLPSEALDDIQAVLNTQTPTSNQANAEVQVSTQQPAISAPTDSMLEVIQKYVPDIDNQLHQRILEFKHQIYLERLNGLRDRFFNEPSILAQLDQVEQLAESGEWQQAIQVLNQVTPAPVVTSA